MPLNVIAAYFRNRDAERDEGFRQEILRLSHQSLEVLAIVQVIIPTFIVLEQFFLTPESWSRGLLLWEALVFLVIGIGTGAIGRSDWSYARARAIAWVSTWLTAANLVLFSLLLSDGSARPDHSVPPSVALVLMVAVAVVPFRARQTFFLGLTLGAMYWAGAWLARPGGVAPGIDIYDHLALLTLTVLNTLMTAVIYAQRAVNYQNYLRVLQAAQDLREAQSRGLQSENAAALENLVAAISHEMNSPLGALRSGVDTLMVLSAKQTGASPADQDRFRNLQTDLFRAVRDSAARLEEIVGRLKRFSNLDRAEVRPSDLNQLIRDAAGLIDPAVRDRARLNFDLAPIPRVLCRPQQLSHVFSALLTNALGASEPDSVVEIATCSENGSVQVTIRDHGRGIASGDVTRVFEPGFKVAGGRVASGNWSLFGARQIIREHGGEIRISSEEGTGTEVRVVLPVAAAA